MIFNYKFSLKKVDLFTMSKTPIQLENHQVSHFDNLNSILKENFFAIDTSDMGTGKNYVSSYYAQYHNKKVIVISPKTTGLTWNKIRDNNTVDITHIISYESLRGNTVRKPKHGFLVLDDSSESFQTTKYFEEIFSDEYLIILDEFHKTKNQTLQNKACSALINGALDLNSNTRVLMMSATPIDKEEQVTNIFTMLKLVDNSNQDTFQKSVKEYCKFLSKFYPNSKSVLKDIYKSIDYYNIENTCFRLYTEVLKQYVCIGMIGKGFSNIKNGFYSFSNDEERYNLESAINSLTRHIDYEETYSSEASMSNIKPYLMQIEQCKVSILVRETICSLHESDNIKVVLFVNFLDTVKALASELSYYNPIEITGSVSPKKQKQYVEKFQNDPESRVIIMITSLGVGIDLDDKTGLYPRHCYIVPSYSLINCYQAAGRVCRSDTKSEAKIRFVYGNLGDCKESSVIESLNRKSNVINQCKSNSTVMLPSDYENEYN